MGHIRVTPLRAVVFLAAAAVALGAALPALGKAPQPVASAGYVGTHFGDGNLPAGCILDKDADNPDNKCHHMRVGLNALDSPIVNVAVLVPVSPAAERDMRIMRQAVEMWDGGIHMLAKQMNLDWLDRGVKFNVTTELVPVDANGLPTQAINLIKPKIVVIATNPVGGIGIGIDPTAFAGEITNILGISDGSGNPCISVPNPFSMGAWQARPGFDGHHGELGGYEVQGCEDTGGQVCFSVNGSVDPVPGTTDFFSLYDLVAHETGHCLTLGHVGDGAEGHWGVTPTNDIMAYSSDPVDVAKCVSTLDVAGFALRMSNFLDVNGDKKVDNSDLLVANDKKGDGAGGSFHVQHPSEHWYASSSGKAEDCPQPDWGALPLAQETDWQPDLVSTTTPLLELSSAKLAGGKVTWAGTADRQSKEPAAVARGASITDATGDGTIPMTDITGVTASVTPTHVKATIKVASLLPTTEAGRATGYGLYVGGRKFDSFMETQGTSSEIKTIDSGARHVMPPGTSAWDTSAGTVSFAIPRSYLADQSIHAPYALFAATGVHIRTKDWVTSLDRAPETGSFTLAGPPRSDVKRDLPLDTKSRISTFEVKHEGGNSFTPSDTSTYGLPLVPQVGNVHTVPVPLTKHSTVTVTLTWDAPGSVLGLAVKGGSGQVKEGDGTTISVTVPWAHQDLRALVIPTMVTSDVNYTLVAEVTTLAADADSDRVPDVADLCAKDSGPAESHGCPDTDADGMLDKTDVCPTVAGLRADGCPAPANDKVVALLDGKQVGVTYLTRHGSQAFAGSAPATAGKHTLKLVWYAGSAQQATATRLLSLPTTVRPTLPPVLGGPTSLPATGAPAALAALGALSVAGAFVLRRSRRQMAA